MSRCTFTNAAGAQCLLDAGHTRGHDPWGFDAERAATHCEPCFREQHRECGGHPCACWLCSPTPGYPAQPHYRTAEQKWAVSRPSTDTEETP